MIPPEAVSDASPLIAFQQIGRLDLLRHLFGAITIPPIVVRETARTLGPLPDWIVERPLTRAMEARLLASLDEGEAEAIALALELQATWLVLDDLTARRVAESVGLPVVGSLGIVVRAKQRGVLPAAKPLVDALIANGLFVGSALYLDVLAIAGETPWAEGGDSRPTPGRYLAPVGDVRVGAHRSGRDGGAGIPRSK